MQAACLKALALLMCTGREDVMCVCVGILSELANLRARHVSFAKDSAVDAAV